MKQTTPVEINDNILNFCNEIDATTKPIFVKVVQAKGTIINDCYGNVENHVKANDLKIQYCGIIWEIP
mgnify:CR=1 FL=1